MVESATGLVLRTLPLTETSLIVNWLTPSLGRIATVAKGARRPRSLFHGRLDLFYLADFTFHRSRRSELHTLREVSLKNTNRALRRDLAYLQQASYCASLVNEATETETPLAECFELFAGFLAALPLGPARLEMVLAFELKLLAELGLDPDLSATRLSPGARQLAQSLRREPWPAVLASPRASGPTGELQRFLHGFIIYHLGRLPRGRDSALEP